MPPLGELSAARLSYRAAVARAHASLRRQEQEYGRLCEQLEAARRDLRAAGYLREVRVVAPTEPPAPRRGRRNNVIERTQIAIAEELRRHRGGPSSQVPRHGSGRPLHQGGD